MSPGVWQTTRLFQEAAAHVRGAGKPAGLRDFRVFHGRIAQQGLCPFHPEPGEFVGWGSPENLGKTAIHLAAGQSGECEDVFHITRLGAVSAQESESVQDDGIAAGHDRG